MKCFYNAKFYGNHDAVFRILRRLESSREQHAFEIEIICKIIIVFNITFAQINASLLINSSYFFHSLQLSQDGKALLDVLQRPLSPGNSESLTATANYSKAVHCILDVVHEVLHHQRRLESIWQHRKVRLHQRLQLCVFQQDVQQVDECSHMSRLSQTLTNLELRFSCFALFSFVMYSKHQATYCKYGKVLWYINIPWYTPEQNLKTRGNITSIRISHWWIITKL